MSRARELADSADKDITGTLTADGLNVDGSGTATITTSTQNPLRLTSSTGYSRLQLDNSADLDAYSGVASTGQALFFETAATERMRLDSSGRLGLGTTLPDTKIHITGNSSVRNTVVNCVTIDGGTSVGNPYEGFGTGITIQGYDYGDAVRDYAYIQSVMTGSSSSAGGGDAGFSSALTFSTTDSGSGSNTPQERMRINANGIVTKPAQPAFRAVSSAGWSIPTSTQTIFPANSAVFNVGGGYNTGTYKFTAPVAGVYYFYGQFFASVSAARGIASIFKNDAQTGGSQTLYLGSTSNGGISYATQCMMQMVAGDTASFQTYQESGGTVTANANAHLSFWYGYLLG